MGQSRPISGPLESKYRHTLSITCLGMKWVCTSMMPGSPSVAQICRTRCMSSIVLYDGTALNGPMVWNPDVYLAFADHRGRPFFDLLSRVGADKPRRVVDLGCGPGNLTVTLKQRWPDAVIEAVDSSPEMVTAARERGLDAAVGDVSGWAPRPDTGVVVTNAVLQWVPEHTALLTRWAAELDSGAWLAMQVPVNFDAPSHRAVREVARRPEFTDALR